VRNQDSEGCTMSGDPMLYDDGRIVGTDTSLVMRGYYAWRISKTIPYPAIRSVSEPAIGGRLAMAQAH
jgi:hypothetical protein